MPVGKEFGGPTNARRRPALYTLNPNFSPAFRLMSAAACVRLTTRRSSTYLSVLAIDSTYAVLNPYDL